MSAKEKIQLIQGDITQSQADAIVNAANTELWLGSGVAAAIRNAGGPTIQAECEKLRPIDLGEAVVTGAGKLKCRYVIHAASMDFDTPTTAETLYDSVKNSFLRAEELELRSIALPAIGTGEADFDPQSCAELILSESLKRVEENPRLERVEIYLFEPEIYEIFQAEYEKL